MVDVQSVLNTGLDESSLNMKLLPAGEMIMTPKEHSQLMGSRLYDIHYVGIPG